MAVMDIYVRVSDVHGREGESYGSPAVQEAEARDWAARNGVTIGVVASDENTSGLVAPDQRAKLERLLRRCETGESLGIITRSIDRFARDTIETAVACKRLRDAGARVVATLDGSDSSTELGRRMLFMQAMFAEDYANRVRANWQSSIKRAVDRGCHVGRRAPLGYNRIDDLAPRFDGKGRIVRYDGRLVADEEMAPHVRRLFELRASGASLSQLVVYLREHGIRPASGSPEWNRASVAKLLRCRTYLGELRGAQHAFNPAAHEPIVDADLFAAAQAKPKVSRAALPQVGALHGLLFCAGCGRRLHVSRRSQAGTSAYACSKHSSEGRCAAPSSAKVDLLDTLVLGVIQEGGGPSSDEIAAEETRWLAARDEVGAAQLNLNAYLERSAELIPRLGIDSFTRGLVPLETALDDARTRFYQTPNPGVEEGVELVYVGGRAYPYRPFNDMDLLGQRANLKRLIERIDVARTSPGRGRWQPLHERVTITWRGGEVFDRDAHEQATRAELAAAAAETATETGASASEKPSPVAKPRPRGNRRPAAKARPKAV